MRVFRNDRSIEARAVLLYSVRYRAGSVAVRRPGSPGPIVRIMRWGNVFPTIEVIVRRVAEHAFDGLKRDTFGDNPLER